MDGKRNVFPDGDDEPESVAGLGAGCLGGEVLCCLRGVYDVKIPQRPLKAKEIMVVAGSGRVQPAEVPGTQRLADGEKLPGGKVDPVQRKIVARRMAMRFFMVERHKNLMSRAKGTGGFVLRPEEVVSCCDVLYLLRVFVVTGGPFMLKIRKQDLVLEIGSGNRPRLRSDILVDRYPDDSAERAGGEKVQIDTRPFIVADGAALPFKDKSFDYVITSHTLEHVGDPQKFVSELMRVAKAGYIETPSELSEKIFGWPFHRWIVRLESGTIIMRPRREDSPFGRYFHDAYAGDSFFKEFVDSRSDDFVVKYEWQGAISLRTVNDDDPSVRFNPGSSSIQPETPWERLVLRVLRFFLKMLLKVAHHFRKVHH